MRIIIIILNDNNEWVSKLYISIFKKLNKLFNGLIHKDYQKERYNIFFLIEKKKEKLNNFIILLLLLSKA